MPRKTTIDDVEFQIEGRGSYIHWGRDGKPDVMISQMDKNDYDCYIHELGTGEVLDQKEHFTDTRSAAAWAKARGCL